MARGWLATPRDVEAESRRLLAQFEELLERGVRVLVVLTEGDYAGDAFREIVRGSAERLAS